MADSDRRRFLVDSGLSEGQVFCNELLSTGEFDISLLRKLGATSPKKNEAAEQVTQRIIDGEISTDEVMLRFCMAPRTWLFLGTCEPMPEVLIRNSSTDFLTKYGPRSDWYGPFEEPDSTTSWWVWAQTVQHQTVESTFGSDTTYKARKLRWHVVVQLEHRDDKTLVALHWHGFSHNEKQDDDEDAPPRAIQFPYWKHIPALLRRLPKELSGEELKPVVAQELHKLVLYDLMDHYEPLVEAEWQHLKVRAESEGIAMNARSAPIKGEFELKGIRTLTTRLADSTLTSLGLDDTLEEYSDYHQKVESALLKTFVREWGTRGYECRFFPEQKKPIRAYFFFGGSERPGPDALTHIKTYKSEGWSSRTRDFLVTEIWP